MCGYVSCRGVGGLLYNHGLIVPIEHRRLLPKLAYGLSNIRKKPLYNKACGAAPDCCGGKYAPVLNITETNRSPLLEY